MIEIINKAKSWFFRKINKIDKSLLDWWRKISERAHNDNYTEMKGIIMLDFIDINMHIYFKQLYAIEFVMIKISLKMLP